MIDWVHSLPAVIAALLIALEIVICLAALGVIPRNRKPSTGMAWLILVLAVPFFGLIAFLFFGSTRVERGRHEKQRRVNDPDPRADRRDRLAHASRPRAWPTCPPWPP